MSNEKGLTLIEVIAAILLLSIIFITVFSFFTHSFKFNVMNDDSIQAMNIAREQEVYIKELSWDEIIPSSENNFEIDVNNSNYYKKQFSHKNGFQITIYVKKNREPGSFYHELHQVRIEVRKNGKLVSETYTYHEGNVVSP